MANVTGVTSFSIQIPQNGVLNAVNTNGSYSNATVSGVSSTPLSITSNTFQTVTPPTWAAYVTIVPDGTNAVWIGGTYSAGPQNSTICDGTKPFIGPLPILSGHVLVIGGPVSTTIQLIWS